MASLRLRVFFFAVVVFAAGARAEWTFVMMGDTRGHSDTTTGVSKYLGTIATQIAGLRPDLVLVTGDLINGNDTINPTPPSYAEQYTNWQTAMSPVTAAGIALYPIRGNHDNNCDEGAPIPALKQAYYDAFGSTVPQNGPNTASSGDQRGFTYSFTHKNATIIGIDQYFYYNQSNKLGYHSIDQSWLTDELQKSTTPYKIVMAHEPAFKATENLGQDFFGPNTDAESLQRRADFWNSLGDNNARLYVDGHVHNFSVSTIQDAAGLDIHQLTSGNGGAPLDPAIIAPETGVTVEHANGEYFGFALATVSDASMKIDYYRLDPSTETWSLAPYSTIVPVPEPAAILSLAGVGLILVPLAIRRWRNARRRYD